MKNIRNWLHGLQWVNVAVGIAGFAGAFPESKTALAVQALIAALLPSLGGASHIIDGTQVVPQVKP